MDDMSPLISAADLARLLALKKRTVYKPTWQRRLGLLPVHVGRSLRFRLEDVRAFLEAEARRAEDAKRRHRELAQLRRWAARQGIEWPDSQGPRS